MDSVINFLRSHIRNKRTFVIGIVMIVLIVLIDLAMLNDNIVLGCKDGNRLANNNDNTSNVNRSQLKVDSITKEDLFLNGLNFGTPYKEVAKIMGEPHKIIPIEDAGIVQNIGYFTIFVYNGIELTITVDENYNVTNNDRIVELDVITDKYYTSKGIHIGSTKSEVQEAYGIKDKEFNKRDEGFVSDRISGFRRDAISLTEYDTYCFITDNIDPIGLIFLFAEDKVVRLIIRHLTAD